MFGFIEVFGKSFIIAGTRAKYVGREIRVTGHGMDMRVHDSRWNSAIGEFGGFNVDQIRQIANEAIRADREHCVSTRQDDIRNLSDILSALLDSTWQKFEIVSDCKIEIVSPNGVVEYLIPTENGMIYRSIFQDDEFLTSGETFVLDYVGVLARAHNRRKGN